MGNPESAMGLASPTCRETAMRLDVDRCQHIPGWRRRQFTGKVEHRLAGCRVNANAFITTVARSPIAFRRIGRERVAIAVVARLRPP